MSGQPATCPIGVTLDPTLCSILNDASRTDLSGPVVEAPVSVQNNMLPNSLVQAINTGSSLIGYNFETGNVIRADTAQYTVDTYATSIQNSAVLVEKPTKTVGTLSAVAGPDSTGKFTATVTYNVSNTPYTFTGSWFRTVTNGETVDVYYKTNDVSRGSLNIEGTGVIPPSMASTPGYELIDFQASVTAGTLLSSPTVTTVDECADRCDDTTGCVGFNFGGLDTNTVCELVNSTTTREYVDNKVGFVKENIPTAQTGDGSNRPGTDLTNQGAYCENAPACNRDIARVINENGSATDPIASFSTSDLDSCAYCPIRKYNRAGHVTTNEVGVSKGNASPADAIAQLQYGNDGTFASHVTLEAGKFYNFQNSWADTPTPFYAGLFAIPNSSNNFKLLIITSKSMNFYSKTKLNDSVDFEYWMPPFIERQNAPAENFSFEPVHFVTDGFKITMSGVPVKIEGTNLRRKFTLLNAPTNSQEDLNNIYIPSEITPDVFYSAYLSVGILTTDGGRKLHPRPPIFVNASNELFHVNVINGKLTSRKIPAGTQDWYLELLVPSVSTILQVATISENVFLFGQTYNKIPDTEFWEETRGSDLPEDPYEQFGQYRTLDVAPPPAAQDWAYARRQGCDKNCGSVSQGYAIYKCTASGGGNCDPGKGAYVSGPVCGGTHISCRPGDNSTDMKAIFSYQFAGLRVVSSVAISGGSNSDHNTDSLRIRTIYVNDPTQTVTTDITKVSTLFRLATQQRFICLPGTTRIGVACSTCPRMQYPSWSVSSATSGPNSYWPDSPIPSNVIWRPNSTVPGTYLCSFIKCEVSGTWGVDNNTICGGTCARGTERNMTATNFLCDTCTVPSNVRIDQTWDFDMINYPDGSGQVETYKCTMRQCPTGFYTYNYNLRYCQACGDDTTTSFTFNAAGFHTQYGYTPPAGSLSGTTGDWTLAQKRAYCTFAACKPGFQNYVASSRTCTQSCPTTPGFTTVFGPSGCTVSSCTINPNGGILIGGLSATSGLCEATTCKPGYGLSGGGCVACSAPQGATVVYDPSSSNQTCRVTSCTLTGTPPASVTAYEVVDGYCSPVCSGGYYKNASGVCTVCSGYGAVNDPGTVPVYSKNTCQITSCGVDSTLTGKATATVESVSGYGLPPPQYCKTSPAAGYYKLLNGSIFQCPVGDQGTQYTYTTSTSMNCALATCSLSTTSDPNEIAYQIASTGTGQLKCSKVCRSGYKRNASDSNRCSSQCTGATTDPGITVTYGPYECRIASCTSSTGFNAISLDNLTCGVYCPQGSQPLIDPQQRTTCSYCSTDLNVAPWSYAYVVFGGSCTLSYGGCQAMDSAAATVLQSGSTCVATCKTGYVRDSTGFCRACPNETPRSISVVTNGVCVSTCKTGHLPNIPSEYWRPVCSRCDTGYAFNSAHGACEPCNTTGVAIETASYISYAYTCGITCRINYYYNTTTGLCTTCPGLTAGLDDPGVKTLGYDTYNNSCGYRHFAEPWWQGQTAYNSQWCSIRSSAKFVGGTIINWSTTDPTTMACTSTCQTGYTKTSTTRLCDQCAADYRWNGTACVACGPNMTTPAGPASGNARAACVCKTGYVGTDCMTCATNYTWNGSACVACQNGSTIVSGPASGNARSCVCPTRTWGSTCTTCKEPIVGQHYVYAVCTPTTDTDIREPLGCGAYVGVPQYRSGYVAGSSTSTGQQGTCTPCQVPPAPSNNPNFTYISTACGLLTDSVLTTPTPCSSIQYRSGFEDGTQTGRPGNPGTCLPCSNPGTNQWVGQVCESTRDTIIYSIYNLNANVPVCTSSQYRSGFIAGNYNTQGNPGTCLPCSNPGTNQYVTAACGTYSDTQNATVPACLSGQYRSGFSAGNYATLGSLGTCIYPPNQSVVLYEGCNFALTGADGSPRGRFYLPISASSSSAGWNWGTDVYGASWVRKLNLSSLSIPLGVTVELYAQQYMDYLRIDGAGESSVVQFAYNRSGLSGCTGGNTQYRWDNRADAWRAYYNPSGVPDRIQSFIP